jgi:hypothetical protein
VDRGILKRNQDTVFVHGDYFNLKSVNGGLFRSAGRESSKECSGREGGKTKRVHKQPVLGSP